MVQEAVDNFTHRKAQYQVILNRISEDPSLKDYQQQHFPNLIEILCISIRPDFPQKGNLEEERNAIFYLDEIFRAAQAFKAQARSKPYRTTNQTAPFVPISQAVPYAALPHYKQKPAEIKQPTARTIPTPPAPPAIPSWKRNPYLGFFCLLVEAYEALLAFSNATPATESDLRRRCMFLFSTNPKHHFKSTNDNITSTMPSALLNRLTGLSSKFVTDKALSDQHFYRSYQLLKKTLEHLDLNVEDGRLEEGLGLVRELLMMEKSKLRGKAGTTGQQLPLEDLNKYLEVNKEDIDGSLSDKIRAAAYHESTKEQRSGLDISVERAVNAFHEFGNSEGMTRNKRAKYDGSVCT